MNLDADEFALKCFLGLGRRSEPGEPPERRIREGDQP